MADGIRNEISAIAYMASCGLTDSEIAAALSMDIADVRADLELASVPLGAAHDSRVERALYERAVGTESWAEKLGRDGVPVRLHYALPADVPAARALLEARKPSVWRNDAKPIPPAISVNVRFVTVGDVQHAGATIEHDPTPPPQGGAVPQAATGGGLSSSRATLAKNPSEERLPNFLKFGKSEL